MPVLAPSTWRLCAPAYTVQLATPEPPGEKLHQRHGFRRRLFKAEAR